ncbi:dihydrodipicolinate synthase family protein [Rhizobium sp. 007]|uniref:dihydrodipicolinate synthase family protein n=1 Tax=Rhizobium sp. 007 TaxID=2785056 RepID=UPI00188E92C2|nr:dihydrodipicolinate synthase family protein [Rhizobium sp. 007]QPB24618.1 dihydrodipicolinate synthase family protein [Rhizobium sp. 007]
MSGLSKFPITPMKRDGQIAADALRGLIARLCAAEVDSIGLLGSTGTHTDLARKERRRALALALEETGGRLPVVVGVGALRTDEDVRLAQDSKALGAAGLLATVSYAPSRRMKSSSTSRPLPMRAVCQSFIYDNPGTTHFRFTPALVGRLAKVSGTVAIKNPTDKSDEIGGHLAGQRGITPDDFSIGYSGDWNATEAMICGADTWYSVLAEGGHAQHLSPHRNGCSNRRYCRSAPARCRPEPVWDLFRQFSSLRSVYALADSLGISQAEPPRPILPLSELAQAQDCLLPFPYSAGCFSA